SCGVFYYHNSEMSLRAVDGRPTNMRESNKIPTILVGQRERKRFLLLWPKHFANAALFQVGTKRSKSDDSRWLNPCCSWLSASFDGLNAVF
ncbi:hypothetical protein ACPFTT_003232, partial [Vibrio cholerae]